MRDLLILARRALRSVANLRRITHEFSLFRVIFTLLFCLALMAGLWRLFYQGFHFLSSLGGVGLMVVHRLFALFFLGLGLMLSLSSVITTYATLYRAEDVGFLLLRPLGRGNVVVFKFLESSGLAAWAFFFMIFPFVGAYAAHERLPVLFSVWTLVFSLPFVVICTGIGALLTFLILRYPPPKSWLASLAVALAVLSVIYARRTIAAESATDDVSLVLTRLIPGLKLSMFPLWPSWWVAEGIMTMSRGQVARGLALLGVLVANAALVVVLVEAAGRRWFFPGWQRLSSRTASKRGSARRSDALERWLRVLPGDFRVIIAKDVRQFFRDAIQWSQFLVFFGILAIYFLNLRNLHYDQLSPHWRNLIAFLNVFSVCAVMCSFGSRFFFPQLSLEGQGFWVLGLAPTTMGRVLAAKFLLALASMTTVSLFLMAISVTMLEVETAVRVSALAIALGMSLAVSGLSIGLGAVYMDLRQRNPAAIISGFGGTLNLTFCLLYMIGAVFPFGFVLHAHHLGMLGALTSTEGLALALVWLTMITAVAVGVPLWLGHRSLLRREYG